MLLDTNYFVGDLMAKSFILNCVNFSFFYYIFKLFCVYNKITSSNIGDFLPCPQFSCNLFLRFFSVQIVRNIQNMNDKLSPSSSSTLCIHIIRYFVRIFVEFSIFALARIYPRNNYNCMRKMFENICVYYKCVYLYFS